MPNCKIMAILIAAWATGVQFGIDGLATDKTGPGSAYYILAPNPNPYTYKKFATGEWNSVRIVVVGDCVEHWMNGVKVVGYKYHNQRFWDAYDRSKWNGSRTMSFNVPGDKSAGFITEGNITFQPDGSQRWQIRNLRIREITNPASIAITPGRHPIPGLPSVGRGGFMFPWGDGSHTGADGRISAPRSMR